MTRAKFFKWCKRADTEYPLSVTYGMERLNGIPMERAVYLNGCWANSSITYIELYRPLPGRQALDCYQTANQRGEEARKKFQRWLDEFQNEQN